MTAFTREAIKQTFISLLEERPLSKITVKDVVDRCGINRNTFYYHFADLPSLAQAVVTEDAQRIMESSLTPHSIEECLDTAISFAMEHRKAVLNLYHSGDRDLYETYQWQVCRHVVAQYIDAVSSERNISEENRELLTDYLKWLLFGFAMDSLDCGLTPGVQDRFHRLCQLKQGDMETLLDRFEGAS